MVSEVFHVKQKNRHRLPLFWRLTFAITAAWLLLLTATLGLTMHFSMRTMESKNSTIAGCRSIPAREEGF